MSSMSVQQLRPVRPPGNDHEHQRICRGRGLGGRELPDAQVLKASMLTYAVPLVGLDPGLWLGSEFFPGREAMSLLTALIGAVIFFAGVRLVDRTLREKAAWQPRIIAVRPADSQEAEAGVQSED